jgi:hypothetical protein
VSGERWQRVDEPLLQTLARTFTIAAVVGVAIGLARHSAVLAPVGALAALWPSLGGHFVEIAFLDFVRPRLPRARLAQVAVRIVWWFVSGALLGAAMIATARLLVDDAPTWRWLMGGLAFIGIELVAHTVLALRRRPSFYRGDG